MQNNGSGNNKFQASSSAQGAEYHRQALVALQYSGFAVVQEQYTVKDVGIRLDAIARNRHGLLIPFEFKGSFRNTPGLRRSDSILKAIGEGYLLSVSREAHKYTPMVILTSHLPTGANSIRKLAGCERSVILMSLLDRDSDALSWLFNLTSPLLSHYICSGETVMPQNHSGLMAPRGWEAKAPLKLGQ